MMPEEAAYWVAQLGLIAHPEGGYFREVYRSSLSVSAGTLGINGQGARSISTSIYFLITSTSPSHFHRLAGDELWHHYAGGTVEIPGILPDGSLKTWLLGKDQALQSAPQLCIPGGVWFGARMLRQGDFALCGCTMAPGFDFNDFELAERQALAEAYPQHQELIATLTKSK